MENTPRGHRLGGPPPASPYIIASPESTEDTIDAAGVACYYLNDDDVTTMGMGDYRGEEGGVEGVRDEDEGDRLHASARLSMYSIDGEVRLEA